jgi:hypothetical protein
MNQLVCSHTYVSSYSVFVYSIFFPFRLLWSIDTCRESFRTLTGTYNCFNSSRMATLGTLTPLSYLQACPLSIGRKTFLANEKALKECSNAQKSVYFGGWNVRSCFHYYKQQLIIKIVMYKWNVGSLVKWRLLSKPLWLWRVIFWWYTMDQYFMRTTFHNLERTL